MRTNRRLMGCVVLMGLMGWSASAASAGVFKDLAWGLQQAGFTIATEANYVSGGGDFVLTRTFNNETLDFGAAELTLQGTPRMTLTTGRRGLDVLDFSLSTAGSPFNYSLVTDTGNQLTTIDGSFFLDATASVNSFGYYDLNFEVSSRQTITQDGRFVDDVTEEDFDLGPIDLRGNIFADLLASVTDPIFQVLGIDNVFAQFSGAAQFEAKMTAEAALAQAKAEAGISLTGEEVAHLASIASMGAAFGLAPPDLSFLDEATIEAVATDGNVALTPVPEPATFVLLGVTAVVCLRRRAR